MPEDVLDKLNIIINELSDNNDSNDSVVQAKNTNHKVTFQDEVDDDIIDDEIEKKKRKKQ